MASPLSNLSVTHFGESADDASPREDGQLGHLKSDGVETQLPRMIGFQYLPIARFSFNEGDNLPDILQSFVERLPLTVAPLKKRALNDIQPILIPFHKKRKLYIPCSRS